MTTTDHLDGEIRRAVQEIGDAAGVPPTFDDLDAVDVGPLRRPPRWGTVAAVAAAAALVGIVLVARPDGASPPTGPIGTDAVSVPTLVETSIPTTAPDTCQVDGCPDTTDDGIAPVPTSQQQALLNLVRPLLPSGFRAVYASAQRLQVVAYGTNFDRIDLVVSLDHGEQTRRGLASGLHPVPEGSATADGLTIVTALDDVVTALPSSAPNDSAGPGDETRRAAAALVADVAASLDAATRDLLRGGRPPVLGTTELRQHVSDLMEEQTGWTMTGNGGGSAGDMFIWVTPRESGVGAGTIALSAYYTDLRLPDGSTRTGGQRVSATRWVGGWQLIVTAHATEGDPAPASEEELEALLDALGPAFTDWRPAVVSAPVCGSYTFARADDVGTIADRFSVTIDELVAVNPDILDRAIPGDEISVPCAATEQRRSADTNGLDGFSAQPAAAGENFAGGNSVTIASADLVWIVAGGTDTTTGQGTVRVERFDRATGAVLSTRLNRVAPDFAPCDGPIEVLDDPTAPLEAIPARCTADGRSGSVDVWNAGLAGFTG